MQRDTYEVVVVGLGIMGAATLFHLARLGIKALGVEARGPLHREGSSHGDTRIFRRAYFEGDQFIPLLNHSYGGWLELAEATSEPVAVPNGALFLGRAGSSLVAGSLGTAQRCGVAHELLSGADIVQRFPAFHVSAATQGVYEADALMLFADTARLAFISRAVEAGAHVVYGRSVRTLQQASTNSVRVGGDAWQVSSAAAVLTVGSWIGDFLADELAGLVTPMRMPVFRFDLDPTVAAQHLHGRCPAFIIELDDGRQVYGLPKWRDVKGGLKLGFHNRQLSPIDPSEPRQPPTEAERLELWEAIREVLPGVRSTGTGVTCVYTMSRDSSFLIQRSRAMPSVVYASACSGHGFKFAPAIGEVLAQLSTGSTPSLDISAFDPSRLRSAS